MKTLNRLITLLVFFFISSSWSQQGFGSQDHFKKKPMHTIELLIFGLQSRLEDTSEIKQKYNTYEYYSLRYETEVYEYQWQIGTEYITGKKPKSGNLSLSVEESQKDYLLLFGFSPHQLISEFLNKPLVIETFLNIYLGSTQTTVDTQLLGQTTTQESVNESVIGGGAEFKAKWLYCLSAIDLRVLGSNAYSPQYLFSVTGKIGFYLTF